MRFNKWLYVFAVVAFAAALLTGLYALAYPFGVSGDTGRDGFLYGTASNVSAGEAGDREKYAGKYNAFILGGDSAGSYSAEKLDGYTGYSFYNMSAGGRDLRESCIVAGYLMDRFDVKCLVLNIGIRDLISRAGDAGTPAGSGDKTDMISRLPMLRAPAPPEQSRISLREKGTQQAQYFALYDENGSYRPSVGDILPIGDMKSYLENHRDKGFLKGSAARPLPAAEECLNALSSLKKRCDREGVRLIAVFEPTYTETLSGYSAGDIGKLLRGIADTTDYWCFSFNSACKDCRYFYDAVHFREAAGRMALARIFGDTASYVPGDYGVYVTQDNIEKYLGSVNGYFQGGSPVQTDPSGYTAEVKILLYHNVTKDGNDAYSVSEQAFASHMEALLGAGYEAISFDELIGYVEKGADLPEKSVIITFDDGYSGVYQYAYPILREYGMKATVFVIGTSVGKDTYKATGIRITPHFSYSEAQKMIDSGLISIQTHSFDMHMVKEYDGYDCRAGVLRKKNETVDEYVAALRGDLSKAVADIEYHTTGTVDVLAYPYGDYSILSELVSTQMGMKVTLSTAEGSNMVVKGLPQSLYALNRYGMDNLPAEALLRKLSDK